MSNEETEKHVDAYMIKSIKTVVLQEIKADLKRDKNYDHPVTALMLGGLVLLILSIIISSWLLLPVMFGLYFIYDFKRRSKYVLDRFPVVMEARLKEALENTLEAIKDIEEDLEVKIANNIYSERDIADKNFTLMLFKSAKKAFLNYLEKTN
jgi:hypothetical protein